MTPLAIWFETARFAADSQRVIWLRLLRLASNDGKAAAEASGMVSEKISALMDSQMALVRAAVRGNSPEVAMRHAMTPYRRRVRANLARLSR